MDFKEFLWKFNPLLRKEKGAGALAVGEIFGENENPVLLPPVRWNRQSPLNPFFSPILEYETKKEKKKVIKKKWKKKLKSILLKKFEKE